VFVPVLGWVAFNILGPGLNQVDNMAAEAEKKAGGGKKRGVLAGLGAGLTAAALALPEQADAAMQVAQTADARLSQLALVFVPVLGWVAFNILGPGLNQVDNMAAEAEKKATTPKRR